jgi:hypothetical protein
VNCAPGTFYVKDNMIITTGVPTGFLRTKKQYENFIAEFDWMHVPPKPGAVGNSGFFVWADPIPAKGTGYTRGIEVQVLVNLEKKDYYTSQGDLFSIWGATCVPDRPHPHGWERCLPSENRTKGEREWNHYRVEGKDGRLTLAVNGKVVSGVSKCNPRKGYLALESEGSECRFKNLKIKELPSTNPTPKETADVDKGFKSLYTGVDLSGWKDNPDNKGHWQPRDWQLVSDGKGKTLRTQKKNFGDYELICDWNLDRKLGPKADPLAEEKSAGIYLHDDQNPVYLRLQGDWHRYHIRVKGGRVTVHLDGKEIAKDVQQPATTRGSIGLFNHGAPVHFANVFIRELPKE